MRELHKQAANSSDYPSVHICFEDPGISCLFAHLLESRGIEVILAHDLSQLLPGTKIVTEPRMLRRSSGSFSEDDILLVANDNSIDGLSGILLLRPLTEEKVEHALDAFLSAPVTRRSLA